MSCLCGCKKKPELFLENIEKQQNISYLTDAEILFFFDNISGFDSSGIYYFVLSYKKSNVNFLSQFDYHDKDGKNFKEINRGKNLDFEEKVNSLITNFMKDDYESFDTEYKINWDEEYLYLNDTPPMIAVDCPMIYFEESSTLFIISLQM